VNFVIGQPRSGTGFIAHLLNSAGSVVCLHQNLLTLTCHQIVPAAFAYYEKRYPVEEIERLIKFYDMREEIQIDSSWHSTWMLRPLQKAFPQAKFVHLVRDPRSNIRAMYNEHDFYGTLFTVPEAREAFMRWCVRQNRSWLYVLMHNMLSNLPRIDRADWDELSPFERNCAFWAEGHRLALDALSERNGYLLVRLEDLGRDAGATATRILEFLDLPVPPSEKLSRVLGTKVNSKEDSMWTEIHRIKATTNGTLLPDSYADWPRDYKETLKRLCGDTAARLGYSLN
jgi:hypothetical protein